MENQELLQMQENCREAYEKANTLYTAIKEVYPELSTMLAALDGAYGDRQDAMCMQYLNYGLLQKTIDK